MTPCWTCERLLDDVPIDPDIETQHEALASDWWRR